MFIFFIHSNDLPIDPSKVFELPENIQERDKYLLYSEMILQLQMARDHLLMQQSEKPVSYEFLFFRTPFTRPSQNRFIICAVTVVRRVYYWAISSIFSRCVLLSRSSSILLAAHKSVSHAMIRHC